MKRFKNVILIICIFAISAIFSINVFGATSFQSYTMGVSGSSSATKGSNITLTYTASDLGSINNGFDGYEGYINYDTSKLEFVNATNLVSGWVIYTNKLTNKIKFLGYDDNPPNNAKNTNTDIFKATFKVLDSAPTGDTVLSMTTIKGTNGAGIKVVANDFSKTITIGNPTVSKSSNANLSSLSVTNAGNNVPLSPSFNKGTTSYTVNVSNNVDKVNIAATLEDSKAKIISGLGDVILSVGNNPISVVVQAENGEKKTYGVNIVRGAAASNNANLSGLSVGSGTLSPVFDPNNTSYKVTVDNNVSNLDINALTSDPKSKVTISGNKNLSVGKNNVLVEVTAEDGSKKVYTIEVTKKAPASSNQGTTTKPSNNTPKKSSNANLKSISGIPGLDFDPDKTTYDVVVPFETTDLNISASAASSKAKVNISNSSLKNMEIGKTNTVSIAVTAEDGSMKVYTINIKRSEYSSETDLKQLTVNGKDLLTQNTDTGEFKITVDKDTDRLDISAIPMSEGSKIKIIGNENLKDGKNSVIVEVTDKNGFTKSYKIDVEKESDNAILSFLKDYWILLLLGLLLLLLILLISYLNRNNKTIIYNNNTRIVDNKKLPPNGYIESNKKELGLSDNLIDNDEDILYNSNDNNKIIGSTYAPRHADDDTMIGKSNGMNLDNIMRDEDVSKVKKEVTIVRDELHGDDMLEKEYTITENYRKK